MELKKLQFELKERVAKGLNFGIEALEETMVQSSDDYNRLILLKSKYNDLMHVSSMNTMPYAQIEIGLDKLRSNLVKIIDDLEEEDLSTDKVDPNVKVNALPTRRTNFFKLLEIHFQNLNSICYRRIYSGEEADYIRTGREGVFELFQSLKYDYHEKVKREQLKETPEGIRAYFRQYFEQDSGMFEVYFKNLHHMISYILSSEIERQFFMDTLRSLFSRFELAFIYYYALSGIEPSFKEVLKKSDLISPNLAKELVKETHFALWQGS